jgi:1,2-dihydroxy-3-keto-5-methylthiopentene dioxygenase
MTALWIFDENASSAAARAETDESAITRSLAERGVHFERWPAPAELAPGAGPDEVMAAYRVPIERLRAEGPYPTVDVVRLARTEGDAEWPAKARAAREKFLAEHTHDDDEIRFFVEGRGAFYLHIGREVLVVLCERGDRIAVPAGTTHWFDMGMDPAFCAIRFFRTPDGWVGRFTGETISTRFPSFDELVKTLPRGAS